MTVADLYLVAPGEIKKSPSWQLTALGTDGMNIRDRNWSRIISQYLLIALLVSTVAWGQQGVDFMVTETENLGEGWDGFTDFEFLLDAFLTLMLATVLGTIFAYHPRHLQTADTLEELEAPRIHIVYAVIGSIIGILVIEYGLVVGFILFGIGGLMRFRTSLSSASLTGRVIFVTLIGLTCGLNLPHVAVLVTVFGWVLIYFLDWRITYRVVVKGLSGAQVGNSAPVYRALLEQNECKVLSEKKNPERGRVVFIFRGSGGMDRESLEEILETEVDEAVRGTVDWQVD